MNKQMEPSPLEKALARVGDRWTLLVVAALLRGPRRFGELQADVAGIAPNILSARLKRLERDGVIVARPYSSRPLRLVYEVTEDGRELSDALRLLEGWGARRPDQADPIRHEACGTPLETRWYCPTCLAVIEDEEETDLDFV